MLLDQINAFFEICGAGPILPASLLMLLVVLYGALLMIGALDFDLFDFDVDPDVDADGATSFGFVTLRFLNIGDVPIAVWLSIFALIWWALSILLWIAWDAAHFAESAGSSYWLAARNLGVSLLLTKTATQPLTKVFAKQIHHRPEDLVGRHCVISTYEATPKDGQAKYLTDGAPLLLNVNTRGANLSKGESALIVDYNPDSKIYLVAPVTLAERSGPDASPDSPQSAG